MNLDAQYLFLLFRDDFIGDLSDDLSAQGTVKSLYRVIYTVFFVLKFKWPNAYKVIGSYFWMIIETCVI